MGQLNDLAAQVAEQRSRFSRLTQYTHVKLARKKNGSIESLRPKEPVHVPENNKDDMPLGADPPALGAPSYGLTPVRDAAATLIKDGERKRKPTSSVSGASGLQRYRTRSMIIVYYDAAIQEAFEKLVRNIAAARNNLRKARTAASYKLRMASLGMEENPFSAGGEFAMLSSKMMRPRLDRPDLRSGLDLLAPDAAPAYDDLDRDLDTAQGLCEVAAHQFLRDGDCSEEIMGTRQKFENCQRMVDQAVKLLETDKSGAPPLPLPPPLVLPASTQEAMPQLAIDQTADRDRPKPLPPYISMGTVEVDNGSDASSVHIDLTAIRRTRR